MIVFDGSKNHVVGQVVIELRNFVPECGVVLIAFQNKWSSVRGIRDVKAERQVFGDPTNKVVGRFPGRRQRMSQQTRCRRFPVSSADDKITRLRK